MSTAPTVEHDGTHLRLLAIAFGTSTIVERSPDGFVAYRETWDPDSVAPVKLPLRLLIAHDRRMPVGWLESVDVEPDGIWMNGRLVGSPEALTSVRALAAEELRSAVSIGFHANPELDQWAKPEAVGGLATVTRRGARLIEASLVDVAAITGSRLAAITVRAPGLSPASKATLAAIPKPSEKVLAYRRQAAFDQIRREVAAAPPRQPTAAELLTEATQLVAAGQRWRTPAPAPRPAVPAVHAPGWDERWHALLAREPSLSAWHARRSWEGELAALLAEPHD